MRKSLLFSIFLIFGTIAHGQIILDFEEVGTDLRVTASGTFQVNSASNITTSPGVKLIRQPNSGHIQNVLWSFWGDPNGNTGDYLGLSVSGTLPVQMDVNTSLGERTGNMFGYEIVGGSGHVYGPASFSAGDSISGTATFYNLGFANIGMTAGTSGSFSVGSQNFNWNAITAVPEPSTYALISIGVLGACLILKRRHLQLR